MPDPTPSTPGAAPSAAPNAAPSAAPGAAAGVDVGGTFTDVVVVDGGEVRVGKLPTTQDDQGRAVAEGVATVGRDRVVPRVAHGTTTATNAVLERAVARTVFVTTEGFADLLTIARQDRPSLYDLDVVRPSHLVAADDVVLVRERMGSDGAPVLPLTDAELDRVVDAVAARRPESVAVCLLFSYAGPAHEERLTAALADRLGVPVTRSSALVPELREYERASTCVLNAAVAPVMGRYLGRLAARLPDAGVTVMTSGGGVVALESAAAAPVHTLLSGPAAGVVAAAAVARSAGFADAVAFDMGGTSTDVCLITGGRPDIGSEGEIGGLPFRAPAVAIHTVGAGGGSIAWLDAGGALRVGPRSAGAQPGPACYGHGGEEATVTDAHCAAGHLAAGTALGGGALTLDGEAAAAVLGRLGRRLAGDGAEAGAVDRVADGILTVARATMGRALRRVTTERGVDPRDLALVAYGGAGPLHATALARELGCAAVVIPPAPGVLSALGLLLAPPQVEAARTVMARIAPEAPPPALAAAWSQLEEEATAALRAQGVASPPRWSGASEEASAVSQEARELPRDEVPGREPLLPSLPRGRPGARSTACSNVSVVSVPKVIGTRSPAIRPTSAACPAT
jgi:N-methylhydantoinase A